ncbi:MAG: hypothetical protein JO187_09090 [Acidobacteria bacterium]|nr:hypothetical protein [Acidobacteriaceae bacterium]MBV9609699.1 hypothetical protein [Acidobacteriota bacterium]
MPNFGADYHITKMLAVFTELMRSGRYSNPEIPIESVLQDFRKTAETVYELLEKIGGMAGS